jgi:putative Holliday junction resolvase
VHHSNAKLPSKRDNANGCGYIIPPFCDATFTSGCCQPGKVERFMASTLINLADLAALLPPRGRLLGLDLGTKTIGLALTDVERRLASPFETIRRVKFTRDVEQLLAAVRKFDVQALIIGLPLNMDGTEGPRAQATRAFFRTLAPLTDVPCAFWDERLSTAAVTRDLIANDVSRTKRAEVIDKMAAAYILQGALDRLAYLAAPSRNGLRIE